MYLLNEPVLKPTETLKVNFSLYLLKSNAWRDRNQNILVASVKGNMRANIIIYLGDS